MKKIVGLLVFLIVAAIIVAAVYIMNIDWNQHKGAIAKQFYNITGKHVVFDGRVSFEIFPTPYLRAVNAKVYNSSNKEEKPLLEIKNVMAELALGPLLKGEFDVKKMVLEDAVINLDWDNGSLNWQGDLSPDQRQIMENTKMVLNSVSLKNAKVNVESAESGVDFSLSNLNGAVTAQSIFGPFRIEGNYLKGNTPQGFALTIGKLSDNFATPLNAVVTYPKSNSYVRFDGTFHLTNKVLNGSVIAETQRLGDFIYDNFGKLKVDAEYNRPMALGFDVALTSQNADLTNIVVKYAETQGAGNIQIPLEDKDLFEAKAFFEFADLNLDPLKKIIMSFYENYKEKGFETEYPASVMAEIKAIRALYEEQALKNLKTEFLFDKGTLTVNDFSAVVPGNTALKFKGSVYPYEGEVYYKADVIVNATDVAETLKWLNIEPKANATAVYKKMLLSANIAGNFDKIQISPFKVSMDKSTVSGEAGIVLKDRKDIMLVVKADTINFDNYISSLPVEIKNKTWAERMAYRFEKLGFLNDFDLVLDAKADMIIYEAMPFEKVDIKGNIFEGKMDIEYAKAEQVASSSIGLRGKLYGFGDIPQMEGFQYDVKSDDLVSLINKLELRVPKLDYKKFNNLSAVGTINGNIGSFGINTQVTIGEMNASYEGRLDKTGELIDFEGAFELKHPELVRFLQNIKSEYVPKASDLGQLRFKSFVKGGNDGLEFTEVDANVGYMNVLGNVAYEYKKGDKRSKIVGDFKVNKLEPEKFLVKNNVETFIKEIEENKEYSFLKKPFWSAVKIDYTPYKDIDVKADFEADEMLLGSYLFEKARFGLSVINNKVNVSNFEAVYKNTPLKGTINLNMADNPEITIYADASNGNLRDFALGGKVYNVRSGNFSALIDLSSSAESGKDFAENLKGKCELKMSKVDVGGVDLKAIYDGLIKREESEGLAEFVRPYIGSGRTVFDKAEGKIVFDKGKFNLAEMQMNTPNAEVKVFGEGSVFDWILNVVFNNKYLEPKHLPEFSFSLKNAMDNPNVDVNVSSLFKMYKAREDQREAEKEAEIVAEKSFWQGLYNEQKQIADDLIKTTRENLEKNLDEKQKNAYSVEAINQYSMLKQEIAGVLAEIAEKMGEVDITDINNEVIDRLKSANEAALKSIELSAAKLRDINTNDLRKQCRDEHAKLTEVSNFVKQTVFEYNSFIEKAGARLADIVTEYKLENDEEVNALKNKIDEKIKELEAGAFGAKEEKEPVIEQNNAEELEQYKTKLVETYNKMQSEKEFLIKETGLFTDMVEAKVKQAEDAYKNKIRKEQDQRMLNENTGTIRIKKTGKLVTVVRDLEEIKNAEQDINNEVVKVLDFSKEKVDEVPVLPTNDNVVKKGRNIRVN